MAEGKWLSHTPLGAESVARDVPAGESRTLAWGTVSALLTMSTWHCPHRDPSRENHLVPLCPYSYKTHFPLDLLSRSPLPPPLCSFAPTLPS